MITSKNALIEYAMRQLGYPVIQIEISEDQKNDAVNKALQKYGKHHFDGFKLGYFLLAIEQNVRDYSLENLYGENDILEVLEIVKNQYNDSTGYREPSFNIKWDFMQEKIHYLGDIDVASYYFIDEKLTLLDQTFTLQWMYTFNYSTKILSFHNTPLDNTNLLLKCYVVNNINKYPKIYNDEWLKSYTIALMKKQWGHNISKYINVPLPGGASFNGEKILEDAKEEIEKLETDLEEKFSLPIDFYMG